MYLGRNTSTEKITREFPGGNRKMNKIKALLIAGLLSLSSVSFASSVTYIGPTSTATDAGIVADTTQAGIIDIENDGVAVDFTGQLAASANPTTSAWYELNLNFGGSGGTDLVTFGWAFNTAQPNDLTITFLDALGGSLGAAYTNLMGDFNILLAGGTSYRMVLSGSQFRSYDGQISAVPVPAAGILFASALLGAGALGRRKKKSAKTSMVGAFARAS